MTHCTGHVGLKDSARHPGSRRRRRRRLAPLSLSPSPLINLHGPGSGGLALRAGRRVSGRLPSSCCCSGGAAAAPCGRAGTLHGATQHLRARSGTVSAALPALHVFESPLLCSHDAPTLPRPTLPHQAPPSKASCPSFCCTMLRTLPLPAHEPPPWPAAAQPPTAPALSPRPCLQPRSRPQPQHKALRQCMLRVLHLLGQQALTQPHQGGQLSERAGAHRRRPARAAAAGCCQTLGCCHGSRHRHRACPARAPGPLIHPPTAAVAAHTPAMASPAAR
jgi:hypothetical protein